MVQFVGHLDEVFDTLKKAEPDIMVYKKEELPKQLHYTANRRIQDILVEAPIGYSLCLKNDSNCTRNGEYI